ncbi:ATP-binding protein [Nocardioides sp. Arc9.136]|uniref:ATP-binding protein n=1 Tax=Nocardioides sp. Arc9.136 TaxID=2996826 RepID=UPI002666560C|nr:ATP-binding protein [Nocardioides sp. Arc9.136]WKN48918.1 ATP-binding protein [Nocardioides sp. Arc9.136]
MSEQQVALVEAGEQVTADDPASDYTMKMSRLTVDKLGVKLYDRASAVVAELIANGYDADAETVIVTLPLGTELATKKDGAVTEHGYDVTVVDDGHGMTPEEAQSFFLVVGADRRSRKDDEGVKVGGLSRGKRRPVMGRKGIGKLAPFGICKTIEVRSAGGDKTDRGYLVSHFILEFDNIVRDEETEVPIPRGPDDRTWDPVPGTVVTLRDFLPKRVPARKTFERQVARRFSLARPDFTITINDTRAGEDFEIPKFDIEVDEATKIDVASYPVECGAQVLPVTGWMAFGKKAIKNEEEAGVRIYARGKIVATTRDFEQPAGFTGEFTARSYLVGEMHAEWLDLDNDEDLVRTDRQGILWDSEYGEALRAWGAARVKQIAKASAGPRRESKVKIFLENSRLEQRAKERYGEDNAVLEAVMDFGKKIGGLAHEDELEDTDYVDTLVDIILQVGPHQALINSFKAISKLSDATVDQLLPIFRHTRTAELASYAQIAHERVKSVVELREALAKQGVDEGVLQQLLAGAPWLIRADWSVITQNQSLKTFRSQFAAFWEQKYGDKIEIAISFEKKRPDFTLVHVGLQLHVVEIKKPGHAFDDKDYERLENYLEAFEDFFESHKWVEGVFSDGWVIDLVADDVNVRDRTKRRAFNAAADDKRVLRQNWNDFLARAEKAHEGFLEAYDKAHEDIASTLGPDDDAV